MEPKIKLQIDLVDPEEGLPNYMRECDPPRPSYDLDELTYTITTKTIESFTPGLYSLAAAYLNLADAAKDEKLSHYADRFVIEGQEELKNAIEDSVEEFLFDVLDNGPGRDYLYSFTVEVTK